MSNLGMGVMLKMLSDYGGSREACLACIGKKIAAVSLDTEDTLRIAFEDGSTLRLSDGGQSCCERRYMTCEDDLPYFVGAVLVNVEVREADEKTGNNERDGCEDIEFLLVTTDRGVISCTNHNDHNGYYGGFSVGATLESPPGAATP